MGLLDLRGAGNQTGVLGHSSKDCLKIQLKSPLSALDEACSLGTREILDIPKQDSTGEEEAI